MIETAGVAKVREELKEMTQASHTEQHLDSLQAWVIWACAGVFYLYESILRVSPSVMTEGLMHDFSLTSVALGVLVSLYLYSYTALQIPCGVMVDALGTRKIVTASAAFCTLGTFMFAGGESLFLAQAGRFLIGAGSACAFLSCMKIAAEWFSPSKFAIMSGMTTMMGTIGGTFGGPPLAWMVNNCGGWRKSMMILAIIGVGVTLFSWAMIRDHPKGHKPHHSHELPLKQSIALLVRNPQIWLIAFFGSFMWLPIAAFAELWGVPYLMHTYHIDNEYASMATSMIFIGFALGSPIAAWISDRFQSRLFSMKLSAFCLFFIFLSVVFVPLPLPLMFVLLLFSGICNGGQVLAFACVKEISPRRVSGTAIGFTNAIVMMSGVIFQPLLGELLDWCWDGTLNPEGIRIYTKAAYQTAIIAIPLCIAFSWILLTFVKETHHNRARRRG